MARFDSAKDKHLATQSHPDEIRSLFEILTDFWPIRMALHAEHALNFNFTQLGGTKTIFMHPRKARLSGYCSCHVMITITLMVITMFLVMAMLMPSLPVLEP